MAKGGWFDELALIADQERGALLGQPNRCYGHYQKGQREMMEPGRAVIAADLQTKRAHQRISAGGEKTSSSKIGSLWVDVAVANSCTARISDVHVIGRTKALGRAKDHRSCERCAKTRGLLGRIMAPNSVNTCIRNDSCATVPPDKAAPVQSP